MVFLHHDYSYRSANVIQYYFFTLWAVNTIHRPLYLHALIIISMQIYLYMCIVLITYYIFALQIWKKFPEKVVNTFLTFINILHLIRGR